MGNKQKNKTNIIQNGHYCYLLCPKCWNKIPYLNTFIDGNNIKIKILCTCFEKNNFVILELLEYINLINNRNNSNPCLYHPEIKGTKFCMNCENWLCESCLINHTKDTCISEYNNSNYDKLFCSEHTKDKKIYFCKQCRYIFCKICFLRHNIRNKKEHKGINIEYYLSKQKIKSKMNKFNEYKGGIIDICNNIKNEILRELKSFDNLDNKENALSNEDLLNYIKMVQDKYLIHKNINEQLKYLIEIILKNSEYYEEQIINRKFICNIIMNTSINLKIPKLNKDLPIIEQIEYFTNFLNKNYINKKLNSNLNLVDTIEKSINVIEMMLSLPDNKFVSINKDCAIQIWDAESKKNIYTLHEHANNITSIILLKNKKYFGTASDDSTIKIWDYSKGSCIKTIITEGKPFLIFEPYNKENQIGCVPYRNSLVIYDYGESNPNLIFNISLEKSIPWIEGLYKFPNDERIILSTNGFFQVFSHEIEEIRKVYIANDTPKLFLQLNNKDLCVGFLSKDIFIYNKDLMYKTKLVGHKKRITSILEFYDNKLLTASLDSNIILWNSNDYEMISSFINNNYEINALIIINKNRITTSSYYKNNILDGWELEIYDE